jgi:hypothetical protein
LLQDIHSKRSKDGKEEEARSNESLVICRKIFYGLLQEEGPLAVKAKAFLRDQLIESLPEQQWIDFILEVYTQPDESLIGHLASISIPIRESFDFLVKHIDDSKRTQLIF